VCVCVCVCVPRGQIFPICWKPCVLGVFGKCENPEFSKFMKRPCFLGIDLSFLQAGSKTIARGG
jgi:hypothetical protein